MPQSSTHMYLFASAPSSRVPTMLLILKRSVHASQDLEILRGYVPGYDAVLGHEFVGTVAECSSKPELVGQRVVGEINCRCDPDYLHADPIFLRNHAPQRTVLGIIGKDVGTPSIPGCAHPAARQFCNAVLHWLTCFFHSPLL